MRSIAPRSKKTPLAVNQTGINMVDLMMWLVIAALLLAAALQSIGYYQKAATMYQLQSSLEGAGTVAMGASAQAGGIINKSVVETAAADAKWNREVNYTIRETTDGTPYMMASNTINADLKGVYLFRPCDGFKTGFNKLSDAETTALDACGVNTAAGSDTIDPKYDKTTLASMGAAGSADWYGVSSSGDGSKIVAGKNNGDLYVSKDSGKTWTAQGLGVNAGWFGVDSSDDGNTIVAGDYRAGNLFTSTNGGTSWTTHVIGSGKGWYAVDVSSDGKKMLAGNVGGFVHTSTDSGATWSQRDSVGPGEWHSLAISDDGTKMFAASSGGAGPLRRSSDGGATWTSMILPANSWRGLAMSADGSKVIVGGNTTGSIYTSSNFGTTWTTHTGFDPQLWTRIAVSDDGSKIVAGKDNGYLYTSVNGGATWKAQTDFGTGLWYGVASSSDGSTFSVSKLYKGIYTGQYS